MKSLIELMAAIEGASTDPAIVSRARLLRGQFQVRAWLEGIFFQVCRGTA